MSDRPFDPTAYGPAAAALLREPRVMDLGPGAANEPARPLLQALTAETLLAGRPVKDRAMADACRAGLWLYHDFLDESHRLSQDLPTPTGSYWHALMHRREPDYDNAKYWFRRVGDHPVYDPLRRAAADLVRAGGAAEATFLRTQTRWDAFAFVDFCEACEQARSSSGDLCAAVQMREWELLFDWCWRQAAG